MGIPKFFRWISERYPLCSQLVVPNEIPEFDNFYLDMNGIIHNCYREGDLILEEHQIFARIFAYVEDLYRKIRPKSVFFLAIDGVAPRAKMNQQRSRRFRSAMEKQQDAKWKAGDFDSNCITPGTPFMMALDEHLKYFLQKKLSEDPDWKGIQVIYSGHAVPGEGEHKIMEYIRLSKAQPSYNPNVRHCLYGLDADLIMLGLVTHDPHFCLLREEVVFGKGKKAASSTPNFHLLHICLLREYIDLEFSDYCRQIEGFDYNLERILDDFIMFSVLVGNDFLPSLSFIHIHEGAYEMLFERYIQNLQRCKRYLNQHGKVNFDVLLGFLQDLSQEERTLALKGVKLSTHSEKNVLAQLKLFFKGPASEQQSIAFDQEIPLVKKICYKAGIEFEMQEGDLWLKKSAESNIQKANQVIDEYSSKKDCANACFLDWKTDYYLEKIGDSSQDTVDSLCSNYLEGLQWVMLYYFEGVPSWSWYYASHYSPKVHDLVEYLQSRLDSFSVSFDQSQPFRPFEQLMAVLPSFSAALLPQTLSCLMRDPASPIVHFYPLDFKTDLNGKAQEWEAVVLIPFIDEKLLLQTIKAREPFLSQEERERNKQGQTWSFTYSTESPTEDLHFKYDPKHFSKVQKNKCCIQVYNLPVLELNQSFVKGLCEGVRLGVRAIPGFPTLATLPLIPTLADVHVRVFSFPSKFVSLLLNIIGQQAEQIADHDLLSLIGKLVYYQWPYLKMAVIESITNGKYIWTEQGRRTYDREAEFEAQVDELETAYTNKRAVNIGTTNYLVCLKPFTGIDQKADGSRTRSYSHSQKIHFPLQMIVHQLYEEDARFLEEGPREISLDYAVGDQAIYIGTACKEHYGSLLTVKAIKEETIEGEISFIPNQFSFVSEVNRLLESECTWYPIAKVAGMLHCSVILLTLLTSPFYLEVGAASNNKNTQPQKINVGFPFKNESKKLKVVGISKKHDQIWYFSKRAVDILRDFIDAFPDFVNGMQDLLAQRKIVRSACQVLGLAVDQVAQAKEEILKIKKWISFHVPEESVENVPIEGEKLSPESLGTLTATIDRFLSKCTPKTAIVTKVLRAQLVSTGSSSNNAWQAFQLGHRAIFTKSCADVPLGAYCTIVGVEVGDGRLQVLTDFPCGSLLTASSQAGKRLFVVERAVLLNLTKPQPVYNYLDVKQSGAQAAVKSGSPKKVGGVASGSRLVEGNATVSGSRLVSGNSAANAGRLVVNGNASASTNPTVSANPAHDQFSISNGYRPDNAKLSSFMTKPALPPFHPSEIQQQSASIESKLKEILSKAPNSPSKAKDSELKAIPKPSAAPPSSKAIFITPEMLEQ